MPPVGVPNNVMVAPIQTEENPEINDGAASTVTDFTTLQPVLATEYVIRATPEATPVTTPLADPIVTMAAYPGALHTPPLVASASVMVLPTHTREGPVIGDGRGLTVTPRVTVQKVPEPPVVAVTVTVPLAIPVSKPEVGFIVAINAGVVDQVTPDAELVSVIDSPGQTVNGPKMAPGVG